MNFLNTFQLTYGLHDVASLKNSTSSDIFRKGDFTGF